MWPLSVSPNYTNPLAASWPLGRCIALGFGIGIMYACAALVANARIEDFERYYGFELATVIVLDLLGGATGGAVAGLLLPRVRGLLAYIGTAQAALLPSSIMFAMTDPITEGSGLVVGVAVGLMIGLYAGAFIWYRYGRLPRRE